MIVTLTNTKVWSDGRNIYHHDHNNNNNNNNIFRARLYRLCGARSGSPQLYICTYVCPSVIILLIFLRIRRPLTSYTILLPSASIRVYTCANWCLHHFIAFATCQSTMKSAMSTLTVKSDGGKTMVLCAFNKVILHIAEKPAVNDITSKVLLKPKPFAY